MAIQVTCAKCLTRFQVSEKFAGQEGPCPKCKTLIKVPSLSEEVKVHGPSEGPIDSTGRAISKPIFRQEAPITAVHWTLAGCAAVGMLALALVARFMFQDGEFPIWANVFGAILVSFPMAFLGYALLRDREAGAYSGGELWVRVLICALGWAFLWVLSPIMIYAFAESLENPGGISQGIALAGLIFAGGAISMLTFDFEYLMGLVHAGFYLVPCILMRLLAGLDAVPGLSSFSQPSGPVQDSLPNFGLLLSLLV